MNASDSAASEVELGAPSCTTEPLASHEDSSFPVEAAYETTIAALDRICLQTAVAVTIPTTEAGNQREGEGEPTVKTAAAAELPFRGA